MTYHGPWFKLYHEWSTDPKVQQLSERDQRRMVMIMCFACRGDVPDIDRWAFAMRVRPSELRLTVQRLRSIAFLDDDLRIRQWSDRQGTPDRVRQRQKRNRDKVSNAAVTGMSRDSHVTVTDMSRLEEEVDAEVEEDADKKKRREKKGDPPLTEGEPTVERHDPVPYAEILRAYHDECPTLQRVLCYGDTLRAQVRARWREDKQRRDLQWWRDYFRSVNDSPFLLGHTDRPFNCTFQWLTGKQNMSKVLNGQYAQRAPVKRKTRLEQMLEEAEAEEAREREQQQAEVGQPDEGADRP